MFESLSSIFVVVVAGPAVVHRPVAALYVSLPAAQESALKALETSALRSVFGVAVVAVGF